METLSRLKRRWLQKKRKPSLSDFDRKVSEFDQDLCTRCKELQIIALIERPRTVWDVKTEGGFRMAVIDELSICRSCSLCAQFTALIQPTALVNYEAVNKQSRSFDPWCHYTVSADTRFSFVYFSVTQQKSSRETLLLPLPRAQTALYQSDGSMVTSFGRRFDPQYLDFQLIERWLEDCRFNDDASCSAQDLGNKGPKRFIDCRERRLCVSVDQPYVCLSYVWGGNVTDIQTPCNVLPESLPQTIFDAMVVTLR